MKTIIPNSILLFLLSINFLNAQTLTECDSLIWHEDTLTQSGEYIHITFDSIPSNVIEGQSDSILDPLAEISYYQNQFGQDVKITDDGLHLISSGNYVGYAPNINQNHGQVRVFKFDGNDWILKGNIIHCPEAGENFSPLFGSATAITPSGDTIAVGDLHNNAYVYTFDGNDWVQLGNTFEAGDSLYSNLLWGSIDISNDGKSVIFGNAGSFNGDTINGAARVYEFNGEDWVQKGQDFIGESFDALGYRVRISDGGSIIAISSPANFWSYQNLHSKSGKVSVYRWENNQWTLKGNVLEGDREDDYFGNSIGMIAFENSMGYQISMIVGVPGHDVDTNSNDNTGNVKVFIYDQLADTFMQYTNDITGKTVGEELGTSLSINNGLLAVGGMGNSEVGTYGGIVRLYYPELSPSGFVLNQVGPDVHADLEYNFLGWSVDVTYDGSRLVTGSSRWEPISYNQSYRKIGKVMIFDLEIESLDLNIINSTTSTTDITECDSYNWNNNNYTTSGIYTYSTLNSVGCDSTATLNLTINPSTFSTTVTTICDSVLWNDSVYYNSGTYNYYTTNAKGCDSTATLYLHINSSSIIPSNISTCTPYTWNDSVYSESGIYTYLYDQPNSLGCDSMAILNLTVLDPNNLVTNITACDSYIWNDSAYYVSGTYTSSTIPGSDCQAILNLTINQSTSSSTTIYYCGDSYNWKKNNYYQSGTYFYISTNDQGCTNTDTLILHITPNPNEQVIDGDLEVFKDLTYTYSIEQNNNDLEWSVINGELLADNNNSIEVQWNEIGLGIVSVVETNSNNCSTLNSIEVNISKQDIYGCMDVSACNYNMEATIDDGSCSYAAAGLDCDGNCLSGDALTLTLYDQYDDGWDYYDGSVSYLTINGVNYGQDYLDGPQLAFNICADLLACTEVLFTPANGWANENSWDITDADGTILVSGGDFGGFFGDCSMFGCMDVSACNYDPLATSDNGECFYEFSTSILQFGDTLKTQVEFTNSYGNSFSSTDYPANVNWYNTVVTYNNGWFINSDEGRFNSQSKRLYFLMATDTMNFTPNYNCTYFTITNIGNCSDTTDFFSFEAPGTVKAVDIGVISSSPNPTTGKVKVQFENQSAQNVDIYLINNNGVTLEHFNTNNNFLDIDLSRYPQGTYHVSFVSPNDFKQSCIDVNLLKRRKSTIILTK